MKFILSRNKDFVTMSRGSMLRYGFMFWLVTRIVVMAVMGICMVIYSHFGINPRELTAFGGDPEVTKAAGSLGRSLLMTALVAPVFEELLFRYGLSLRQLSVAVSCAMIPLFPAFSHMRSASFQLWIICIAIAAAVFCGIYFLTTDSLWERLRASRQVTIMWISSVAFGLVHLCAFSSIIPMQLTNPRYHIKNLSSRRLERCRVRWSADA
ncbi:MAG: hypothetical protein K2L99_04785 [Muribaculaceae bacterium]|nr:hypothetical protein [Muribaculaceae bacterium]